MSGDPQLSEAIARRQRPLVEALTRWVAIPSVSTDPERKGDVRRSAEYLKGAAREAGFSVAEIWETDGHPAVFAERLEDPALPTILVYGHHDVQPVDPVDEWEKPPFEALERDGLLLGRGTSDDKGHMLMHLEAVRGYLDARRRLPLNLKLIVEGEEEDGSDHFEALLHAHRERLQADVAVISDTGMLAEDLPALTVGVRGLDYWEVRVRCAATDLHSGVYGGAVLNPITVLVEMLAALHDPEGRVAVPGFYDQVVELGAAARAELAALPFDAAEFLADVGAHPAGEAGFTTLERRTIRPTMEICGIWGGYQGEGSKTVIPAWAAAKLSSRLVPNQVPEQVTALVGDFLRRQAPEAVDLEFTPISSGRWALTPSQHPAVLAAAEVVAEVWGESPVFLREGGSIPAVALLAEQLQLPCVLLGVSLPGDRFHAPNERVSLAQLNRGMEAVARLWETYGRMGRDALRGS
ncbi:MAG: dipeptidase [Candidatus Dormibacteria bacterium]